MWLIIVILTAFRAIRLVIYRPHLRFGRYMSYCPEGSQYYLNMLVWSHSICIQNLGSIGPVVREIQNKGEMCVWACVRVCVIYENGGGLIR